MKVVSFIGSKRKNGNTHLITKEIFSNLDQDIQSEIIFIKDYNFEGCMGCNGCQDSTTCVVNDDMQLLYNKLEESDVVILASPTYYYNVTSDMKKFIDRLFCYNIFDKLDRSNWSGYFDNLDKQAITISVCEQQSNEDLGFTKDAMKLPLQDIGFTILYELDVIKAFHKGDVLKNHEAHKDAMECATRINQQKKECN